MSRTPYDGKPYYCKVCGMGFGEFIACEQPACELEPPEDATARRDDHDAQIARMEVQYGRKGT